MPDIDLKPDDAVTIDLDDYLVVRRIVYRDGATTWTEWLLQDASRQVEGWLLGYQGGLAWGPETAGPQLGPDAAEPPETLTQGEQTLQRVVAGRAHVAETTADGTRFDRADYALYQSPEGSLGAWVRGRQGARCRLGAALDPQRLEAYSA